eukprot:3011837-Rhodomonas_salina.5
MRALACLAHKPKNSQPQSAIPEFAIRVQNEMTAGGSRSLAPRHSRLPVFASSACCVSPFPTHEQAEQLELPVLLFSALVLNLWILSKYLTDQTDQMQAAQQCSSLNLSALTQRREGMAARTSYGIDYHPT